MQKTQMSYEVKVSTISTYRRRGDVTRTSERTGFSRSYVSEVLSGTYRNEKIVNAAFKVANARKVAANRKRTVS
jgi:hypothetical protein